MIPAIVLAAGKSTRMGRQKATLPLAADTFLSRIVRTFREADVSEVIIVVGHLADKITSNWSPASGIVRFVLNPNYETGQFSSLLAGLDALDPRPVSGALITLVDVPLVSSATVRAVVDRYLATGAPIVRPTRGTEHGHPVLIDRSLFDTLRRADPLVGAKAIVRAHASREGDVEVDDEGAFRDVDTMEDYRRLIAEQPPRP
ncbi:MAG: nucleotidyltransferase family protein [Acidobacteriota bacterium]